MNRQIDTENNSNSLLKDKVRAKISRKEYKDVHVNTFALDGKSTVVFSRYVSNVKFDDIPLLLYLDTGHMMLVGYTRGSKRSTAETYPS